MAIVREVVQCCLRPDRFVVGSALAEIVRCFFNDVAKVFRNFTAMQRGVYIGRMSIGVLGVFWIFVVKVIASCRHSSPLFMLTSILMRRYQPCWDAGMINMSR